MDPLSQRPEVEFLILADRAEAINGKLYMMGGGWDQMGVINFDMPNGLSFAVSVLVPWQATNLEHRLVLRVEHEDGTHLDPEINAGINMGRPPQAVPGQSFRAVIAVNGAWKFPCPGTYRITAGVGEGARKDYVFHVYAVGPKQAPTGPC